jgi:aspartyl-tRNA(Asn)/glutamyl-tRNA(Gln) amidotransferase subunit A
VIPLSWTFDHVGPITRTVGDSAAMLHAIAGYDVRDLASRQMPTPDYVAALRGKVSSLRVGVARTFFFADIDPEVEAAVNEALRVLQKITGSVRDVDFAASGQESLRGAVRAAEAYAYHAEFVQKTPELYQPETLHRLRIAADAKTSLFIQGVREVEMTRRTGNRAFEAIDVIVTPTAPIPPPLLAEVGKDIPTSIALGLRTLRNTSPFNVYGWPTISVPCGFTKSGLPIGLQISGPSGADDVVLRLAHAYEQATDWHKRRPPA